MGVNVRVIIQAHENAKDRRDLLGADIGSRMIPQNLLEYTGVSGLPMAAPIVPEYLEPEMNGCSSPVLKLDLPRKGIHSARSNFVLVTSRFTWSTIVGFCAYRQP